MKQYFPVSITNFTKKSVTKKKKKKKSVTGTGTITSSGKSQAPLFNLFVNTKNVIYFLKNQMSRRTFTDL